MPDLLTHVLLAYAAAKLLMARYAWISPTYVTIAMVGALIPDLNHISDIVPSTTVEALLGVPFSWGALQTGGVVLLVLLVGTVLVEPTERKQVFAMLAIGASSHLFTDALIRVPDGRSQSVFWPLTRYQPPTPGLYLNTDIWPLAVAAALAILSWLLGRYQNQNPSR